MVSAFEQNVWHGLRSIAALAFTVSALLILWRYAPKLILPLHIYNITELIALYSPLYRSSVAFPGLTLSLKSSLLCLAVSYKAAYSARMVLRMIDFVGAMRIHRESGSGASGSYWAACLAALSAALLPGIPIYARI